MTSYEHHGQQVFEPQERSIEAHELDSLTLDESKGILHQLGYFAEDTHFFSLRLTTEEMGDIMSASIAIRSAKPIESIIATACREWAERKVKNEEKS